MIRKIIGEDIIEKRSRVGEEIIILKDIRKIREVMVILRDHISLQYKGIIDIVGLDIESKLELRYILRSYRYNKRIVVSCRLDEREEIESIMNEYKGAEILEREVYDMIGVEFRNHRDLRRILTDYGFKKHPLRKDFNEVEEVRYDEEIKAVRKI